MKKTFFLLLFSLFCILPLSVFAVDFKIRSYQGDLYIHADNTAEYREKVVYHFDSDLCPSRFASDFLSQPSKKFLIKT